jgi:hypothetical protein
VVIDWKSDVAGVKVKASAHFAPEEMGFGIQTERKLNPSMIAIPI